MQIDFYTNQSLILSNESLTKVPDVLIIKVKIMDSKIIYILLAIAVVGYLGGWWASFGLPAPSLGAAVTPSVPSGGGTTVVQTGVGYATTVTEAASNAISGASVTDSRGYLYASDGSWSVTDISIASATTTLSSSAPNSLSGYAMIGNDQNQGSDGGTEWYYRKVPVNYQNTGAVTIKTDSSGKAKLYAETTSLTTTFYEDGNATNGQANFTFGTSIVSSNEVKMQVASSSAFGNPDFENPIGICINASQVHVWNSIKPTNYIGTFPACEAQKGMNVLGCYILPIKALVDDGTHDTMYRFYLSFDPAEDPTGSHGDQNVTIIPMDKTWYLDDNSVWQSGWCDDSLKGTDYDPGMNGAALSSGIYVD